jgi:hypothetical protein
MTNLLPIKLQKPLLKKFQTKKIVPTIKNLFIWTSKLCSSLLLNFSGLLEYSEVFPTSEKRSLEKYDIIENGKSDPILPMIANSL